jgi:hypothetical protein
LGHVHSIPELFLPNEFQFIYPARLSDEMNSQHPATSLNHYVQHLKQCIIQYTTNESLKKLATDEKLEIAWTYYYLFFLEPAIIKYFTENDLSLMTVIDSVKDIDDNNSRLFTKCMSADDLKDIKLYFQRLNFHIGIAAIPTDKRKYLYYYYDGEFPFTQIFKAIRDIEVTVKAVRCGRQNKCGIYSQSLARILTRENYLEEHCTDEICDTKPACSLLEMARFLVDHNRHLDVQICMNETELLHNIEQNRGGESVFNVFIVCVDSVNCKWLTMVYTSIQPPKKRK